VKANRTKSILDEGGTALGVMVFEMATTGVGRLASSAGADFVLLDTEHTGRTVDALRPALSAMRADDVTPLVRVAAAVPHLISGSLDAGALGVMVPMVNDEDQASSVVGAAKFPPEGSRGYGILYPDLVRQGGIAETMRDANDETLVLVQIESTRSLERVDAIAGVPGVDVLWIGQYDLAASMGAPGSFDDPRMDEATDLVLEACRRHGRAAGMLASGPEHARQLVERGFRCVAVASDLDLFARGLAAALGRASGEAG
jgi:2-dehydro-3-deoxyglucarate aldolase/4-hydroxy-2-oxoheptanedioate aldolase